MQDSPDSTPPPAAPARTKDERQWAMFCHLAAFVGFILPFGNIIGPLVLWLIKREESPYIDEQGKEALNFQITMTIAYAVAFLLFIVFVGLLLLPALIIFDVVFLIMAVIKTSEGAPWRYPLTLRLVK